MAGLTIIIPTKDRGEIFLKTLYSAVAASSHVDAEIIVVNNSLTPLQLKDKPANVSVYHKTDKFSVFSARNYGASYASKELLLFIDDDMVIAKDSIDCAIKFHEEHKHACLNVNWRYPPELLDSMKKTLFGRYLIRAGFTTMESYYGEGWRSDAPFLSKSVASFFFCLRKEDFERVGRYNENDIYEGSDVDTSNKMSNNGIAMWINPLVTIYHNEADRIDLKNWLERKKRYGAICRNAIDTGDKSKGHILHYSKTKTLIFKVIYFFQPVILLVLSVFNKLKLDKLGFVIINALLGANICVGFNSLK
ncbi:MAG TPA: glycosyltransferase [Bacteroidia bacterium]|nr:glycosyltransferase [Bacteroidia bacterium]